MISPGHSFGVVHQSDRATTAQQIAMARDTNPHQRSRFERDAKLAKVPKVKRPVRIHIPSLPLPGTQLASMTPALARTKTMSAG